MKDIIGNSFLDKYFDEHTMSLHIKENRPILKKIGNPGEWKPTKIANEVINKEETIKIIEKIFAEVEEREDGFIEINNSYYKVVQLGPYRIVVVHPPLSDGIELTIVKPTKILNIDDYELDQEILDQLRNKSRGILISGAPGSGKTTFAQALVGLYHKDDKIIKTVESPRDLMVSDDVVQYSFTYGTHDDLRNILLLSRPDYTVYDEVRNKADFELFKDLRLTGIGLVGVIHATRPVDSIQRFLGSIEMGIIPQVIDTVIYIDKGKIGEILQLKLLVKVPDGMFSEDLARPIIQVNSFFEKKPLYEIYTFGEQIVVVPIGVSASNSQNKQFSQLIKDGLTNKLKQKFNFQFYVKVVGQNNINLYIPENQKAGVIGKGGININNLEKEIGVKINVKTFDELPISDVKVNTDISSKNNEMSIQFPKDYFGKKVTIFSNKELYNFKVNNEGFINIKKKKTIKTLEKFGFLIID